MLSVNKKVREINLDFIKVLATFLVIKLHSGYSTDIFGYTIHYLSGCAVPLFFMVSGYLTLKKQQITYRYIFHKTTNIFVTVSLWVLLYCLLIFIKNKICLNPIQIMINSLIFQKDWLFYHFWFLGALIIMYLLSPTIHKIFLLSKDSGKFFIIILLLLNSMLCLYSIIQGYHNNATLYSLVPQTLRLWIWIMYFSLGGFISRNSKQIQSIINSKKNLLFLSTILLSIISVSLQYYISVKLYCESSPEVNFDNIVIILWNFLLFLFLWTLKQRDLIEKISSLISQSIGMYILHPIIKAAMSSLHVWNNQYWIINFIILSLLSFTITYILQLIPYFRRAVRI